jgi:glycopeptide antibiotics resistance protein
MPGRLFQSKWTAAGWTIIIFILMILPPSRIPHHGLFGIKNLDKLVHMILFGGFVWLWNYALKSSMEKPEGSGILARLVMISAAYGIAMEFVQYFFTNRDFDIWDIAADITGAVLAWIWIVKWGKKVSPYGNRGRNQN